MLESLVSAEDLRRRLPDPDLLVVDCRFQLSDPEAGRQAWRAGRIPGARYAHLDDELSDRSKPGGRHPLPEADDFAGVLARWGWRPGMPVVVYDDAGGAIAARLWWMMRHLGHSAVSLLDGGIQAWKRAGGEMESGAAARFQASQPGPLAFGAMPTLDATALSEGLSEGRLTLVDARAAVRFEGIEEPLDTRAGHVPGAVNRPFQDNLGPGGQVLDRASLYEAWRLLTRRVDAGNVHMCGSGVTACLNLLIAEYAGLGTGALYPGSWSDWISHPDRPVIGPDSTPGTAEVNPK